MVYSAQLRMVCLVPLTVSFHIGKINGCTVKTDPPEAKLWCRWPSVHLSLTSKPSSTRCWPVHPSPSTGQLPAVGLQFSSWHLRRCYCPKVTFVFHGGFSGDHHEVILTMETDSSLASHGEGIFWWSLQHLPHHTINSLSRPFLPGKDFLVSQQRVRGPQVWLISWGALRTVIPISSLQPSLYRFPPLGLVNHSLGNGEVVPENKVATKR